MNKQPKLIDADKLEGRLIDLINKYDGKNDREFGRMSAWTEILNEVLDGEFDPDHIPLPTIKPGEKVRHKEYPASKGIVEEVFISAQVNFDDARTDYRLIDLEVISDEKV